MRARTLRGAWHVVVVYWLVLVLGLVLYTAIRIDDVALVAPLWAGALFGTLLGHVLALFDLRMWLIAIIVLGTTFFGIPLMPSELPGTQIFWMTFAPAALFGSLAVADRWSLAAFWFPAVIWMLSILDGTDGRSTPDGVAALLLAGLALAFVAFLRAREIRRVALWTAIAPRPLAEPKAVAVLREAPAAGVRRAAWSLVVGGSAFALTAWLAPQLWRLESFDNAPISVASDRHAPTGGQVTGPTCCEDEQSTRRARVKEYFDIGRGRDVLAGREEKECVPCGGGGDERRVDDRWDDPYLAYGGDDGLGVVVGGGGGGGAGGGGAGVGGGGGIGGFGAGAGVHVEPMPPATWDEALPARDDIPPVARPDVPPTYVPSPEPADPPIAPTAPSHVQPPDPIVASPPIARPDPPAATARTPEIARPSAAPVASPEKRPGNAAPAHAASRPAASTNGFGVLRWLVLAIVFVVVFQIVRYALRPLRRWIVLRHLRRPFWEETVDQRVSNWWQLVLVGLRDAGYRTSAAETPREFARRAHVDGVETAAAILDRARHAIVVDGDDLDEMASAAETAYRSARASTGALARGAALVRWPLA